MTDFGVTVRLEASGGVTVIVPLKAFLLLAGSENLNLPAFEKVQLTLSPAGIAGGSVPPQFTPVVGLKTTVWALLSVFLKTTVSLVVIVTAFYGESGTARLLVFSQVILSMQLPFAVIPLVRFVTDREKMGSFTVSRGVATLAWAVAAILVVLNLKLLYDTAFG